MSGKAFRPLDLATVFARNKAMFGDFRMELEDGNEGGEAAAGNQNQTPWAERTPEQKGYPADTPFEQMTLEQKLAYQTDQAKKHENMLRAERRTYAEAGIKSPEDLASLLDKASKHDALEEELMSDKDRAIAEARKTAESETSSKFLSKLVNAEFRAASAGRVAADKLEAALEFTDLAKFVKDGEVDAEKVAKFVESLAPSQDLRPRGPSSVGMGTRKPSGGAPGDQGRAQAEKRFGKTAS